MSILQIITYASIGGIIPCLIWLIFWLREAHDNPEPPRVILACFIAGMLSTIIVFPLEYFVTLLFHEGSLQTLTLWAFIEEALKLAVCWYVALRTRFEIHPIDAVIYMMTVALGFSAFENTIYLVTPIMNGDIITSVMTGGMRFIGATLLHTLTSAIIGVFIAFSFFKKTYLKQEYALAGLIAATVLHTVFNFFILNGSGVQTFLVFASVWLLIIVLIVIIEKVKNITNPNIQNI